MTALAPIANHLWQSTLFAALVALAILAFRRNRASVRHTLWLTASIKFLIPFAVLTTLGAQLAPVLVRAGRSDLAAAIDSASRPFDANPVDTVRQLPGPGRVDATMDTASHWAVAPAILTIWLGGSLVTLAAWGLQWRRVSALVRGGRPITAGREVDALRQLELQAGLTRPMAIIESPASFEPGVFGIRRPVLLWPATIGDHLSADQLVTILAHEVAHVRRRDNLAAAIQTVISAIFWFHPLVWWIGARLADERERACDEDVLHAAEPELYAETILVACRLYVQAPPSCVAGVASSNLRKRIERIMSNASTRHLTVRHKLLLALVACATIAAPVAVGALTARGPRHIVVDVLRTRLDVADASVMPNHSASRSQIAFTIDPDHFSATNVTLRTLIQMAYRLQPSQITGGADWINSERFDITATSDQLHAPLVSPVPPVPVDRLPMQATLRALLADRFKLVVRDEKRDAPIYALTLASADGTLGPALSLSTVDCTAPLAPSTQHVVTLRPTPSDALPCGLRISPGQLMAGGARMSQVAYTLSGMLDRPVIDRTGLTGSYTASLSWIPASTKPDTAVFPAIEQQLGLKLAPDIAPIDMLVIVSAQRPPASH
jgi:bla regulator protein blaR1